MSHSEVDTNPVSLQVPLILLERLESHPCKRLESLSLCISDPKIMDHRQGKGFSSLNG